MNDLKELININGTKPLDFGDIVYMLEIKGTKFSSPVDCYDSFLLGKGEDKYKTCIGDIRYKLIERWLIENIINKVCKRSRRIESSYGIKHRCGSAIGGYVSNETVKFILSLYEVPTAAAKGDYPINLNYYVRKM